MASPLEIAINFLRDFGFFDVVLPFLLVFTIVFAILEKTMILGSQENKPKKNLNSIVAFSIAFFVIAATNVVSVLQQSLPQITLVLIVIICLMLLVGSFMGSEEFSFKNNKYIKFLLTGFILLSVSLIFLGAIKTSSGNSVLNQLWNYLKETWFTGPVFSGLVFLAIILLVILYVLDAFSGIESKPKSG